MSFEIQIQPCEHGRYGYGRDMGSMSGKFWAVFEWRDDTQSWMAVAHYGAEATAHSEAKRRDKERP